MLAKLAIFMKIHEYTFYICHVTQLVILFDKDNS